MARRKKGEAAAAGMKKDEWGGGGGRGVGRKGCDGVKADLVSGRRAARGGGWPVAGGGGGWGWVGTHLCD